MSNHDPRLEARPRQQEMGALLPADAGMGLGFGMHPPIPTANGHTATDVRSSAETPPDLIALSRAPEVLEFPFASLNTFLTPNPRFFVRNHFSTPTLSLATWRLRVEGAVQTPLELTYEDLLKLPHRSVMATLECAGNTRTFLSPPVKGVQWGLGAVGNAEWTGVSLGAVLQRAGVQDSAVEVILEGADAGEIKDPPKPTGPIHYSRSLPLDHALHPEVLLAYRMNGETLSPSHGFPLRGLVPGWYGMASVKWLTRLVVTERPFHGYFQSVDYAKWARPNGIPTRVPLSEMQVKSEIARPEMHEVIAARSVYRVYGAAWSGEPDIAKVEVSTDGGQTWREARLPGKPVRYAWCFWEFDWQVPALPGPYTLMARATDARGRVQPMHRGEDLENYSIHHVLPIEVEVR